MRTLALANVAGLGFPRFPQHLPQYQNNNDRIIKLACDVNDESRLGAVRAILPRAGGAGG